MCMPLIDRIVARIQHWTAKVLSYAGRKQLIKSVLFAITSYWMHIFPIPKKVLKHIEAVCRSFLWTGKEEPSKRALVAWEKVCDPQGAGGLNITSLLEWNIATMAKLLWNIHAKADKLWVQWVHMYFLKGANILEYQPTNSCSWILKGIFKCREAVISTVAWADMLRTGKYKTSLIYKELRGDKPPVASKKVFYSNVVRPRAVFILWLLFMGRLSTKDRLTKFGITTDGLCCFCGAMESADHLFFHCSITAPLWSAILTWTGITHTPVSLGQ